MGLLPMRVFPTQEVSGLLIPWKMPETIIGREGSLSPPTFPPIHMARNLLLNPVVSSKKAG
jgi:hypothetical protein